MLICVYDYNRICLYAYMIMSLYAYMRIYAYMLSHAYIDSEFIIISFDRLTPEMSRYIYHL